MEKKISKQDIMEIIDSNNNLIGTSDLPASGSDKETEASKTTDYNAKVHGQNYKNDFLGRFGFFFYEADEKEQPAVVKDLMATLGSEELAWEIMNVIKPHIEKVLDEMPMGESVVTEAKVVEDKLADKREDNDFVKGKDNTLAKMERVADLLAKLPKNDLDKLMTLLEAKKKK